MNKAAYEDGSRITKIMPVSTPFQVACADAVHERYQIVGVAVIEFAERQHLALITLNEEGVWLIHDVDLDGRNSFAFAKVVHP